MAERPKFPHLDNLERVPQVLTSGPVTITEKIHGFNARVGRDADGVLWVGTRELDYDAADAPLLQGLTAWAVGHLDDLPRGITVYGEWAGKGVQKGIDYGAKRFFAFAVRVDDGPILSSEGVLADVWLDGVETVPVIWEGDVPDLATLDEWRDGESRVAPGQPIEGIVVAPVTPVFDKYGHQTIGKHKSRRFAELSHAREERPRHDLTTVTAFAEEYVNEGRLGHVLDQVREDLRASTDEVDPLDVRRTGDVLRAMYQDVLREGSTDHDALSDDDKKAVGKAVSRVTLRLLLDARAESLAAAVGG